MMFVYLHQLNEWRGTYSFEAIKYYTITQFNPKK